MKKILPVFVAFTAIIFSCTGNKAGTQENVPADSDSIKDTAAVDTMEMLISETPMPKAADELFDDFFFNYAANRKLQLKRTAWPLPSISGGKTTNIDKNQWKTEHFFMHQGYYTLILNNEREMRAVKDTSINVVRVEKIYLSKHYVKQYVFNRNNGLWMLDSIVSKPLAHSINASFLNFYHRFATDTAFQCRSVSDIVQFSGPDPDDDFSTMEGVASSLLRHGQPLPPSFLPLHCIMSSMASQSRAETTRYLYSVAYPMDWKWNSPSSDRVASGCSLS